MFGIFRTSANSSSTWSTVVAWMSSITSREYPRALRLASVRSTRAAQRGGHQSSGSTFHRAYVMPKSQATSCTRVFKAP